MLGNRASPLGFAGPRRFQPPAVDASGLPGLDAVVISHDHYDHLDRASILAIAGLEVPFITSLGVGAHLESWGISPERIIELDWWEQTRVPGTEVVVTATPSQHFSGRGIADRNRTLWSSFVLQGPHHKIFFGADTGLTPEYTDIGNRFGPFDLSMLEIGAFHPAWSDIHLGPEGALEALAMLGGGPLLPVHWGTFDLATHGWDDPPEQLLARGTEEGVQLIMPPMGQPVEPARVEGVDPWWRQGHTG
jgi:L-ascorbate metabolism protein UlaG (beta-lactamase superfamily)